MSDIKGLQQAMTGATESPASPEGIGTLTTALAHAEQLLKVDPERCIEQTTEILKVVANEPRAGLLLGVAQRILGQTAAAVTNLQKLVAAQPYSSAAQYELGVALSEEAQFEEALAAWRRAVELNPDFADAWRAIGAHLRVRGDTSGADLADAEQVRASTKDPQLLAAGAAMCRNDIPLAETLLRDQLKRRPADVAAMRMLAEVAGRLGRYLDAEDLLGRCLQLAPHFHMARYDYAVVLNRQGKSGIAIDQIEYLLSIDPHNPGFRNLRAVILAKIGDYQESLRIYAEILAVHPLQPGIWLSYGHALAAAGKDKESIAAYRRAIALSPHSGEPYWSLANLKTFRFTREDIDNMCARLARADLSDKEQGQLHFAVGKALEDCGDYASSFEHYASGNRLRRAQISYDAEETSRHVRASTQMFNREFFEARADYGEMAPDPIFIVGLPRAGSTLIEQILASHSAVEGTAELPDIISIARTLGGRKGQYPESQYPGILGDLSAAQCRELGQQYLARTRIQRKTDKPIFIDKMPNNFLHIGLIRLILPNAKIIDARRQALACCFSAFKQYFANGQNFTYDLGEIGQYYRDYVTLMRHMDDALPSKIHRVQHERLIAQTEAEVRRLLNYCGLPFEPGCLRFYENPRAVRTASSQQVRRPISHDGLDQWRHFEAWLDPLKEALGTDIV